MLRQFCGALLEKAKTLFKDFLHGGNYFKPSESVLKEADSCPPNNICVERLMAQLDHSLVHAPIANTNTMESQFMFQGNGTALWLQEKHTEDKVGFLFNCLTYMYL